MRITIKSNIRDLPSRVDNRINDIKTGIRNLKNDIIDTTYETMVSNAPVRTGGFRSTIVVTPFGDQIKIGPTHRKTMQIVRGSRPTKGAYVPSLNRRVKKGYHPGTRPHRFVNKTLADIKVQAPIIVDRNLKVYGRR